METYFIFTAALPFIAILSLLVFLEIEEKG
jgi:hypothetical protein